MHLKIFYSDDSLMVIEKPAGLVVDPSSTQKQNTLAQILTEDYNISLDRGGIAHRLDKDTSGLMIIAKTQKALENLQSQFKDRVVKKEYLALVHGKLTEKGVVQGSIGRNPGNREKFTVLEDGKQAVTGYEPIKNLRLSDDNLHNIFEGFNKIQFKKLITINYNQFTLVRCFPETGRTHQIRVHLKHIGNPIVSDDKYGGKKVVRLDRRWCSRQFLHAAKINFKHPETNESLEFESELPEDLEQALKNLEI